MLGEVAVKREKIRGGEEEEKMGGGWRKGERAGAGEETREAKSVNKIKKGQERGTRHEPHSTPAAGSQTRPGRGRGSPRCSGFSQRPAVSPPSQTGRDAPGNTHCHPRRDRVAEPVPSVFTAVVTLCRDVFTGSLFFLRGVDTSPTRGRYCFSLKKKKKCYKFLFQPRKTRPENFQN